MQNNEARPGLNTGVLLQVYLPTWGGGLWGLRERIGYLKRMGFGGVITCPVGVYEGEDGPYSPVVDPEQPFEVAPEFGGDEALRAANLTLREAGITPFSDVVVNHCGETSPLWQRALQGDQEAQAYFRLIGPDPLAAGFKNKVNIFNRDSYIDVPELGSYRSSTFYEDQIEFDAASPAVQKYLVDLISSMHDNLLYKGSRLDAIAYSGGRKLTTRTGTHEKAGLDMAALLRREVFDKRPGSIAIAEVGGTRKQIAPWLTGRRCHWAYDFGFAPAVICSIDQGNWDPLTEYLDESPLIDPDSQWINFMGAHDEVQLRYSKYRRKLIRVHGGPNGEYIEFGGNGLTKRLSELTPSEAAHVMTLGLTILMDGVPLLYQGDAERFQGDPEAPERWKRRNPMVWTADELHGWQSPPPVPFGPDANNPYVSVAAQFENPASPLNQTRDFIQLRNALPAIQHGARLNITRRNRSVLTLARVTPDQGDVIIMVNGSKFPQMTTMDLARWRGNRLLQWVKKGRTLLDQAGDVDSMWTEAHWIGHDNAKDYPVWLAPYEIKVMRPF